MKFYRVSNINTEQGLWYDFQGNFTGLIHDRFNFCLNNQLRMDFDPELVGYISAVETLEQLEKWFPQKDILQLEKMGWFIHEYEAEDFKFYERFQHTVINQESSRLVRRILIDNPKKITA